MNIHVALSQVKRKYIYQPRSKVLHRVTYTIVTLGHKSESYWKNEDEMIIQEYRCEDLTGAELTILNEMI